MTNFLTRLVGHTAGQLPQLLPRITSGYEPTPGPQVGSAGLELEQHEEVEPIPTPPEARTAQGLRQNAARQSRELPDTPPPAAEKTRRDILESGEGMPTAAELPQPAQPGRDSAFPGLIEPVGGPRPQVLPHLAADYEPAPAAHAPAFVINRARSEDTEMGAAQPPTPGPARLPQRLPGLPMMLLSDEPPPSADRPAGQPMSLRPPAGDRPGLPASAVGILSPPTPAVGFVAPGMYPPATLASPAVPSWPAELPLQPTEPERTVSPLPIAPAVLPQFPRLAPGETVRLPAPLAKEPKPAAPKVLLSDGPPPSADRPPGQPMSLRPPAGDRPGLPASAVGILSPPTPAAATPASRAVPGLPAEVPPPPTEPERSVSLLPIAPAVPPQFPRLAPGETVRLPAPLVKEPKPAAPALGPAAALSPPTASSAPSVRISIGRIEVRAAPPPARPAVSVPVARSAAPARMPMADYLKQTRGRRS